MTFRVEKHLWGRSNCQPNRGHSHSALARHAKNPTNTPIPNILGPTSIFIDALEINEIDIRMQVEHGTIDARAVL